ncbi:MAG: hypothetical protein GXO74_05225 [Calditrichaeota bacterium]|nr:hypothetical protein [Calditrichota bacterium]
MIDNSTEKAILEKIISSKAFDKTDKYSQLLTYLVNCSIRNKIPKEYSIAVDVFDKDKDFDPSLDTIVRYYMHRLRKKLNEYYSDEGRSDKIKLVIPKGHYEVKFLRNSKTPVKFWQNFTRKDWVFVFTIVFLCLSALLSYHRYLSLTKIARVIDHPIDIDDPIWSVFFENQLPTILFIGDHFLVREYYDDSGGYREQIDYSITTRAEFNRFVSLHPDRKLLKLDHGSLPHNSIFNLYDIEHVFYSFNQRPEIQFTSENMSKQTDLPAIVDHNIIYMGGFRNLRQLSSVIAKIPVEFKYTDTFSGEIRVRDEDSDSLLIFKTRKLEEGNYLDLGLIAKLPGPNSENYLFFIGFAYPTQIETVRMMSRQESLTKLYNQTKNQYKNFPEYFYMIIEAKSFEYAAQETTIKYLKEIKRE